MNRRDSTVPADLSDYPASLRVEPDGASFTFGEPHPAAGVCDLCGALVVDVIRHAAWHTDTATVVEVVDRVRDARGDAERRIANLDEHYAQQVARVRSDVVDVERRLRDVEGDVRDVERRLP